MSVPALSGVGGGISSETAEREDVAEKARWPVVPFPMGSAHQLPQTQGPVPNGPEDGLDGDGVKTRVNLIILNRLRALWAASSRHRGCHTNTPYNEGLRRTARSRLLHPRPGSRRETPSSLVSRASRNKGRSRPIGALLTQPPTSSSSAPGCW